MSNLRHFVFLEKHSVSIENNIGAKLDISSVVDVASSDLFLFLLESSGIVHIAFNNLSNDDSDANVLRSISFKTFEYEATNIYYCSLAQAIIVIGKNDESEDIKFNRYDASYLLNLTKNPDIPQLLQSIPVFSNTDGFKGDVIKIAISDCTSIIAIAMESFDIQLYRNYLLPNDESYSHHKSVNVDLSKYCDLNQGNLRNMFLIRLSDVDVLFVCTEHIVLSLDITGDIELIFKDKSDVRFDVSCVIKGTECVAVSKHGGEICIYNIKMGFLHSLVSVGTCSLICAYKNYIASASLGGVNTFDNTAMATLITVQSKIIGMEYVAYSQYIPRVAHMIESMGSLFIISQSGPNGTILLFELCNKKIRSRIQILIRKRLFTWAIKLAELENRPQREVQEIYKIHADWLYEKGFYNECINSYCLAGTLVEPAYVIERFLVVNCKLYLFRFLLHLHRCKMDNVVHTMLLMKSLQSLFNEDMNNVEYKNLLIDFLDEFGETHKDGIRHALEECRSSGGFEFARFVALSQNDFEEYITILIEDFTDYDKALEYLNNVDIQIVCNIILKNGRCLMRHKPDSLLQLIRKINRSIPDGHLSINDALVPVFTMEEEFLSKMLGFDGPNSSLLLFSTRLHLLLETMGSENKVWKLLNNNTQSSEYQMIALILCLLYKYKRGVNAMAIKLGYYHLPLVLTDSCDKFNLLEYALHYGYNEPTLWIGILTLLSSLYKNQNMIKEALQHIQNYKLLTFPTVVNIFKNHNYLTFKNVKDYLRQEFKKIEENITECKQDIQQDCIERTKMNGDLQALQHSYTIVNNVNCSSCGLHLEFPCLHFYCKHSFHNYCVGQENKCPKCSPFIKDKHDSMNDANKNADFQDSFFKFLSGSTDPFEYTSQQFNYY